MPQLPASDISSTRRIRLLVLAAVLGVGALLILGLAYLWYASNTLISSVDERAEWTGLMTSITTLESRHDVSAWPAVTHMSPATLNGLFPAILDGLEVRPGKSIEKPLNDVRFQLLSVATTPRLGYLDAEADIRVKESTGAASALLKAHGRIHFVEIQAAAKPGEDPRAEFGFTIDKVSSRFDWHRLSFGSGALLAKLQAAGVLKELIKHDMLRFEFPLNQTIFIPVSVDSTSTEPAKDGGTPIGSLTTTLRMPASDLTAGLSFAAPVFTESGMWLPAALSPYGQQPVSAVVPPADKTVIHQQIIEMRKKLAALAFRYPDDGKEYSLYINGQTYAGLAAQFSSLAPAARTLTATLSSTGRLFQERWRDDVLGEGGVFITMPRAASSTFELSNFSGSWTAEKGLAFSGHISGQAKVGVDVRADPFIGGGTTIGVDLNGSLLANVSGRLALAPVDVNGHSLVATDFELDCAAIPFTLETGHAARVEFGYAVIPRVGVGLTTVLGDKNIRRSILFDDLPIRIPLGIRGGDPDKQDWVVTPAAAAIDITFEHNSVSMTASGSLAWASPHIRASATAAPDAAVLNARRQLEQSLAQADDARQQPSCNLKEPLSIIVGGMEFGPNNMIAKFLVENWNDLTKGPGPHNEVVAAVTRLGIKTKKTNDVAADVYDKLNKDVSDAFGEHSVVADAARGIGKAVNATVLRPNLPLPANVSKAIQPPIPNLKKPCTIFLPFVGCGGGGGNGGKVQDRHYGHPPPT